ncbi:Galactose oxidase/kelch beta-propeller [Arabidopsis suecica]|uniref:Galactose oxidase/kelch beta-propeller n=1 Tax=Arabidopsis suecica TaxID=45249 RepID=A0A8T2H3Y9_ARASU|nr:Galactose oxidase/kelch beta-propeller [Arabidopsis suecica]
MVRNLDDNWDPDLCYFTTPVTSLAIVKATDYKLVWLYNSLKYNAAALSPNEGLTKCEVFDFRANAWRYLTCTPSYRIWGLQSPEYVDGSIFWLTELYNGEIKVIALDIYTETFRLLPKFHPILATSSPMVIYMCTLDNSLCIMKLVPNIKTFKEIWRLKSSQDVWEKIYTIDLFSCSSSKSLLQNFLDWKTLAICNNKKILLSCPYTKHLVEYDPQTKSVCSFFTHHVQCKILSHVPYIQSLISDI